TGFSSTDSGTFANRESYVGVESGFGKVRLGYLSDVLADTESTDNLYGPFRDSMGAGFPLYEGTEIFGNYGDARFKNSIRYDSPDLAGFNATLQYGAGESVPAGQKKQGELYGIRLAYQNSGFFGALANATQLNTGGSGKGSNSSINRLEGGYNANGLYLAATYQWETVYGDAYAKKTDGSGAYKLAGIGAFPSIAQTGANKLENTTWAINAAYAFGNFKPSVVYSKRNDAKIDGVRYALGATQWAAALDYTVSKRTLLEAGYGQVKENKDAQAIRNRAQDTSSVVWAMVKHNF
ncbi:porin, partial [Chromobacterium subtsugae]|uniref:porin n=1 Tax=Chromobacterium subtsugae TaxID=251747 RepID=UPI0006413AA4